MQLRELDLGWLTVIAVGMFSHIHNMCVVGFCGDSSIATFQVDLPFILFILSVLTFVADHNWYPTSLKKPHSSILLFLNIITALTVSNLALKIIWLPLQAILLNCSVWISNWVYNNKLSQDVSRSTSTHSAWRGYFSNILEHHGAQAVPAPMLRFATAEDGDVDNLILQWTDDVLPFAVSTIFSAFMLSSRFFASGFWEHLRHACLSAQAALRRRRGRILLLPGGSLARLRSLAPRYVLSKVDESEDEGDPRSNSVHQPDVAHADLPTARRAPSNHAHSHAHAFLHPPAPVVPAPLQPRVVPAPPVPYGVSHGATVPAAV